MVSDQEGLISLFYHVDMAVVRASNTFVLAHNLDGLIDSIAGAVHSNSLQGITNPVVLLVFATIELHE